MSSIINALLVVGGLLGVVIVFQNRCSWLQLCGDLFPNASATTAPTTTTNNYYNEDGTVNGQAVSPDMTSSRGCCECKMMGDRVKCQKNGDGNWFNPPAGPDGSNDQSIDLSLLECYKTCGSSSTTSNSGAVTGAGAAVKGSASIPKKPKLQASGSGSAGAGVGGSSKKSSSSSKKSGSSSSAGVGSGVKVGASFYSTMTYYNTIKRIQDNSCSYLTLNGKRLSI